MKNILITICIAFFVSFMLAITVRGLPGNLKDETLLSGKYQNEGPLELSPERGRFALTYSIAENGSFEFSLPVARFVTPDLAYQDGRYVSLFAPGVSFIILPGYLIGRFFEASQVGTYAIISFFAILNFFLIRAISRLLGVPNRIATLAALTFLFATPAFAYAVSLYQHHISVFLILLSVFVLLKFDTPLKNVIIWILIGVSLTVDYPNAFMMAPIGIFALLGSFHFKQKARDLIISLNIKRVTAGAFIAIPLLLFFWYNISAYGNPFQLAGTLRSVEYIDETGRPFTGGMIDGKLVNRFEHIEATGSPNAESFFNPRNILNGFYIHFLSPDRGIIFYTPIIILGVIGVFLLKERNTKITLLLLSIIGINILLYSMWGDPWGGWGFGSRYLIPTYALMSIFLAVVLQEKKKSSAFLTIFIPLLAYSIFVNTLGAITTNKLPPRIQVLQLEELSNQEEKFTFERNLEYLGNVGSKSFFYETVARNYVSPQVFLTSISIILVIFSLLILFLPYKSLKKIKV